MKTNSSGGYLDFGNDDHLNQFCGLFGGTRQIRTQCPALWEALTSQSASNETLGASSTSSSENLFSTFGLSVNESKQKKVMSLASLLEPSSIIMINTTVRNHQTGELIAADCQSVSGSNRFETPTILPSGTLPKQVDVQTNYTWVEKVGGKAVVKSYDSYTSFNTEDVITKIDVTAPVSTKNDKVIIVYRRTSQRPTWDYNYDVGAKESSVSIFLPFEGSIEASMPIDHLSLKEAYIEHRPGGGAYFKNLEEAKLEVNGKVATWEFPTDWKSEFKKEKLGPGAIFTFHAELQVWFKIEDILTYTTVTIESGPKPGRVGVIQTIQYLDIQWGCLAKGSQIKMADGSSRPIENIRRGDRVQGAARTTHTVEDIYTGNEEYMVVMRTTGGRTLRLTRDHPVATERGTVRAGKLNAADKVQMEYGTFEALDWLFEGKYNDKVYNLKLDPPGMILAEGIVVGDFDAQQQNLRLAKEAVAFDPQEMRIANELAQLGPIK